MKITEDEAKIIVVPLLDILDKELRKFFSETQNADLDRGDLYSCTIHSVIMMILKLIDFNKVNFTVMELLIDIARTYEAHISKNKLN